MKVFSGYSALGVGRFLLVQLLGGYWSKLELCCVGVRPGVQARIRDWTNKELFH